LCGGGEGGLFGVLSRLPPPPPQRRTQ
jgi:hypothetical protein